MKHRGTEISSAPGNTPAVISEIGHPVVSPGLAMSVSAACNEFFARRGMTTASVFRTAVDPESEQQKEEAAALRRARGEK